MNRRNFFKKTVIAGTGAILIPEIVNAAIPGTNSENAFAGLKKDAVILFQGDSITDTGRKREDENNANAQSMLGNGYVMLTAASLLANNPLESLKIYNRGISGNKVFQLQERWEKDCLSLQPDILSILIGVNDYWHMKGGKYEGDIAKYNADLRDLISSTKKELPGTKIVLCEPFILAGGAALDSTWESEFAGYRDAAKQIARDFNLIFVPFQKVFNEALKKAPVDYWGRDGVHPSLAGAELMSQAWLKAVL
ncbi:MAG: SGNH/GDSL hydrolase family protein [Dysgonamonadaceae bacterium]|jgi:lysophospholipase L1-like esterase|nr:SGNH/GDSL hydrolase family protein [Dysgonamonadaceae bacterium]